ncbi:MAG: hypothetical protein ABJZ55_07860 [Fuerstiella sp.]
MNQDPVKVNHVDWTSVLPSLHLGKALKFSYRARTLVVAIVAVLLVQLVLWLFGLNSQNALRGWNRGLLDSVQRSENPIQVLMTISWLMLTSSEIAITKLTIVFLMAQIIALAFGIEIARAVACEFCVQERSGAWRNLKLMARRIPDAIKIAVAFLAFGFIAFLPILVIRLFQLVFGSSPILSTLWPVLSLVAIPVLFVWLVLLVTGPFAAAAIATDDCEPADAVSRSINYVLSHKLQVVLLISASFTLARLSGGLAELLLSLSMGVTAADLPTSLTDVRRSFPFGFGAENASWISMVQVIAAAVEFAVLQSALTIGYVLLRKTEDSVPYRELSPVD